MQTILFRNQNMFNNSNSQIIAFKFKEDGHNFLQSYTYYVTPDGLSVLRHIFTFHHCARACDQWKQGKLCFP